MNDDDLRALFESVGEVESARIITDRETQRPRGFGFVTMGDAAAAARAQVELDGQMAQGRELVVSIAREKAPR
jgi:RNA recognition motif-containing protein